MRQYAPDPDELFALVKQVKYKPGWHFALERIDRGQDCVGLTLTINIRTPDTYDPERMISVNHYMIVPAAAYDERSWRRWLFEQILLVERHEAMEYFQVGGGRPYAPSHGPGNDPYLVREIGTDIDQRTSFLGEVNPA